jgi:hypothetical protein
MPCYGYIIKNSLIQHAHINLDNAMIGNHVYFDGDFTSSIGLFGIRITHFGLSATLTGCTAVSQRKLLRLKVNEKIEAL